MTDVGGARSGICSCRGRRRPRARAAPDGARQAAPGAGKESYFDGGPSCRTVGMPTMVIRRDDLEAQQFSTQETAVIPPAQRGRTRMKAAGRRLAVSTAIFGLATALSRVLGLVREVVAAYYFGAPGRSTRSRSRSRSRTSCARSSPTRRSRPPSSPFSASCSRRGSANARGASRRRSSG